MEKEEDFLLSDGKESLNIDFENLCVKKRKWNPFFLLALVFLSAVVILTIIKVKSDEKAENIIAVDKESVEEWQGAFVSEAVFLRCRDASVSVVAENKLCSGFVLSKDGWIVSTNSIVNDFVKGKVKVVLSDGRVFDVNSFKESRRAGLVLMKIDAEGLVTVDMSFSGGLSAGQEIYTFCALDGSGEPSFFSGKISHTQRAVAFESEGERTKVLSLMQISLLLTEEGAGAPLFDVNGKLVGICCANVSLGDSEKYMINYAFSTKKVRNLLFKMEEGDFFDESLYSFILE